MTTFTPRMSAADSVMWTIERDPVLRTTITAVALVDQAPDWERLLARLERGAADVPLLRWKVAEPLLRVGRPQWVEDDGFHLQHHVRHVRAPAPGTIRTVLDIAEPLSVAGFDRTRPLWNATLVDGLADGRAAIVMNLHHSLVDGVGGVAVAGMLVDADRDGDLVPHPRAAANRARRLGPLEVMARSAADRARGAVGSLAMVPRRALDAGGELLREPVSAIVRGRELAASAARMLAPGGSPESTLLRGRTLGRHFDALEVDLDAMRRAAKAAGATVNDAFLAAVVGGVARYHVKHGADLRRLRIDMPVNIRAASDPAGGNRFAPTRFLVPADVDDPVERMLEIGAIAHRWHVEPALAITDAIAGVLDALPQRVTTALFGALLKGVDITATNIPGIPIPVYVAGARVERFWALAPPSGTAVSASLLSHEGTACIGVNVDTGAVVDPHGFVACLADAVDEVVAQPAYSCSIRSA